jgi:hypothetical protein
MQTPMPNTHKKLIEEILALLQERIRSNKENK